MSSDTPNCETCGSAIYDYGCHGVNNDEVYSQFLCRTCYFKSKNQNAPVDIEEEATITS
jgi:hypothetical protein